jgi:hypothetical protein
MRRFVSHRLSPLRAAFLSFVRTAATSPLEPRALRLFKAKSRSIPERVPPMSALAIHRSSTRTTDLIVRVRLRRTDSIEISFEPETRASPPRIGPLPARPIAMSRRPFGHREGSRRMRLTDFCKPPNCSSTLRIVRFSWARPALQRDRLRRRAWLTPCLSLRSSFVADSPAHFLEQIGTPSPRHLQIANIEFASGPESKSPNLRVLERWRLFSGALPRLSVFG